jgi:NAD(P)-dependent dehydrogenase (short-subunit alcohol dehydrogenase family)
VGRAVGFGNYVISAEKPLTTPVSKLELRWIKSPRNNTRKVFDINVWGVLNSMKHEVAAMIETGGGAIVNTSSAVGHMGVAEFSVYVASKHAVEGLTKAVALEFAKDNIRVNTVAPAGVATDMVDRHSGKEGPSRDGFTVLHPVGRLGTSEEIAAAVLYLGELLHKH